MVTTIGCRALADKLARGEPVYLVDVRQPWEHERARLDDQLLVPLDELAARHDEVQPPAGALVVCYCHHGIRSLHAAGMLEALGRPGALSLAGGIDEWSREIDPRIPRY